MPVGVANVKGDAGYLHRIASSAVYLNSTTTINMYVMFFQQGVMITDGNSLSLIGGVNSTETADLLKDGFQYHYDPKDMTGEANGKGFFSDVGNFFKHKVPQFFQNENIRKIANTVMKDAILPYASKLAETASKSPDGRLAIAGNLSKPLLGIISDKYGNSEPKSEGSGLKLGGRLY
jgi:hypothetical protein